MFDIGLYHENILKIFLTGIKNHLVVFYQVQIMALWPKMFQPRVWGHIFQKGLYRENIKKSFLKKSEYGQEIPQSHKCRPTHSSMRVSHRTLSKKDGKDQEMIQSSTTPDTRIPHGKVTKIQ